MRGSEKLLGQPLFIVIVATACISLWWVTERGVPRVAVPSPAASVSLAVCPAAAVASCPAGREKPCNVPPSRDLRDSSSRKYWFGASSVGLGVSAAAGTVRGCSHLDASPRARGERKCLFQA